MKQSRRAPVDSADAEAMRLPGDSPHAGAAAYAQAQVEVAAPPERIWRLLTDIGAWPDWNELVDRATLEGPLGPGTVFRWKSKGLAVTSTLREVAPERRLAWTGRAFGTRALHCWELEATPRGTLLRTAESFHGWLPKLAPKTMQRTLDAALPAWLQALKTAAERVQG